MLYLHISGETTYSDQLTTVCGDRKPTVTSTGSSLLLVFTTDSVQRGEHYGYELSYERVDSKTFVRPNPTSCFIHILYRNQGWATSGFNLNSGVLGVENILFSLAIVAEYLHFRFFFSFPVPIPEKWPRGQKKRTHGYGYNILQCTLE